MLLGLEAMRAVPPTPLATLVAHLRAPLLTTYKAKGVLSERDPHWAGILTGGEIERPLLETADAILAIGLDEIELLPRPWRYPARVCSVRARADERAYLRPVATAIGEIEPLVAELARAVTVTPSASIWSMAEIAAHREGALERVRGVAESPLTAARVVEAIQAETPDDVTVAVDAGAHMLAVTNLWRVTEPGRFLISNGLATMGFAVPSALGAAFARPGEPVLALTGDGGFSYHMAELETAARLRRRIIVLVFNDSSLSLIRIKEEARGRSGAELNLSRVAHARLAEGLGAVGDTVTDLDELRAAMRLALVRSASTVIDVVLSGAEYRDLLSTIRG